MAAILNAVLLLSVCQQFSASADPQPKQKTVHLGDDVTLSCEAPNDVSISAIVWTRQHLQKYVYFQRDGILMKQGQDPSFVDRVQLKGQMEEGDLSLILKNVSSNDKGTYECRYKEKRGGRRKRALIEGDPISIFILNVEGKTTENTEGGHLGIILPVFALIVVLAAVVGFVIFKKLTGRFPVQSVDDPDVHQQLQEKENSQSKTITLNISDIQV